MTTTSERPSPLTSATRGSTGVPGTARATGAASVPSALLSSVATVGAPALGAPGVATMSSRPLPSKSPAAIRKTPLPPVTNGPSGRPKFPSPSAEDHADRAARLADGDVAVDRHR